MAFLEQRDARLQPGVVGLRAPGSAAPQLVCARCCIERRRRVRAREPCGAPSRFFVFVEVERRGVDDVPVGRRDHQTRVRGSRQVRLECGPETADQHVDRLDRRGRRVLSPQPLDDSLDRNRGSTVGEQDAEEAADLGLQLDRTVRPDRPHPEYLEHAGHLHRATSPGQPEAEVGGREIGPPTHLVLPAVAGVLDCVTV